MHVGNEEAVLPTSAESGHSYLCVDLDGTLTASDTLHESILLLLRKRPAHVFLLPVWWMKGRAFLKREVAKRVLPDPSLLPYRAQVVSFVREERARGVKTVLATAADRAIAEGVATYLGIFDEIL